MSDLIDSQPITQQLTLLQNKITLLNTDYRLLKGKYDKIVSIEMIEAVGYKNVPLYFKKVSELLNDQGLFAMQGITYNDQNFDIYKKSVDFINKYIFPGSCLIAISQISDIIKNNSDLIFTDLEDITSNKNVFSISSKLHQWLPLKTSSVRRRRRDL